VILLLIASAVVGYIVYQQLQTDQVKVPNVAGYTEHQAKVQLHEAGFTTTTDRKASKKVESGKVISTDPTGGSEADKGSQVTILVSTGPKSVNLPDLHGKQLNDALQILSQKGLPPPITKPIASKLDSGLVVRTDPKPGPVKPDQVVTLFYSNGNVTVPNVVGMSCADATATLRAAQLAADCQDAPSDTAPVGQVFAQSPSAGQEQPQGSTVALQVSTGPAQVQVPDVTNSDFRTARTELNNAGLSPVKSLCLPTDPTTPDGTVIATDPPAGTSVDPKTTVTVYVADAASATPCP
jgi:serine/threonine-protein kinase